MPRLYLILAFCLTLITSVNAQSNLGNYLKHAQEKYEKGDYYYAIELYEKAMQLDSNSVSILWNYAETLKAYKDYRKAEFYYGKVYEREEGGIYPMSLINYGLMQKQNGSYDAAIETFKKAKKKFTKDKKSYRYLKAKRELESCLWAKTALIDTADVFFTRLPETVNTPNSEFGHNLWNQQLYFSSLRADSISTSEEVYSSDYKTRLYSSKLDAVFDPSKRIEELFFDNLDD